jgi:hypothetical protein
MNWVVENVAGFRRRFRVAGAGNTVSLQEEQ